VELALSHAHVIHASPRDAAEIVLTIVSLTS